MNILLFIMVGGILVLYSYYLGLQSPLAPKLWLGFSKLTIRLFVTSMILATIGFLTMYYQLWKNPIKNTNINYWYLSLGIMLISSMFWMESSLLAIKYPKKLWKYIVSLLLIAVSFSSAYLLLLVHQEYQSNIITALFSLFVFHVSILDNMIWNGCWIAKYIAPSVFKN